MAVGSCYARLPTTRRCTHSHSLPASRPRCEGLCDDDLLTRRIDGSASSHSTRTAIDGIVRGQGRADVVSPDLKTQRSADRVA